MPRQSNYINLFSLILIIALGFLLRVYNIGYPLMKVGDEAQHAIVANNTMKHFSKLTLYDDPYLAPVFLGGYKDWHRAHVWLNKPPFSFWLIALFMFNFGPNEFGFRITAVLLSTCSLLITFLISRRLFGQKTGLIAAFLQAISPITIIFDRGTFIESGLFTIFTFWFELTFLFIIISLQEKKWYFYVFSGLFTSIAYLTMSFLALGSILAIVVFFILRKIIGIKSSLSHKEHLKLILGMLGPLMIIFSIWETYTFVNYGRMYLPGVSIPVAFFAAVQPWYFYIEELSIYIYRPLFILFILGFSMAIIRSFKERDPSNLLVLSIFCPYLMIFSLMPSKFSYFVFPIYPFIYILISSFLIKTIQFVKNRGISLFHVFLVFIAFEWLFSEIMEHFFVSLSIELVIYVALFSFLLINENEISSLRHIKKNQLLIVKLTVFYIFITVSSFLGPLWLVNELFQNLFLNIVMNLSEINGGFSLLNTNFFITLFAILPFLFLFYGKHKKSKIFFPKPKKILVFLIVLLIISGLQITVLEWTTRGFACLFNQRFQYREMGYFIRYNTDETTVIYGLNEYDSYRIMFYSDRTAFPGYPSSDRINELRLRGYDVLIISDSPQIPFQANLIYSKNSSIFLFLLKN